LNLRQFSSSGSSLVVHDHMPGMVGIAVSFLKHQLTVHLYLKWRCMNLRIKRPLNAHLVGGPLFILVVANTDLNLVKLGNTTICIVCKYLNNFDTGTGSFNVKSITKKQNWKPNIPPSCKIINPLGKKKMT